jgi:hypothetical protein
VTVASPAFVPRLTSTVARPSDCVETLMVSTCVCGFTIHNCLSNNGLFRTSNRTLAPAMGCAL